MSTAADSKNFQLTRKDAESMIRKAPAGSRFYVHVRIDAVIEDKPDRIFCDGIGGLIKLSKPLAVKFIRDCMSDNLEARAARIPLCISIWNHGGSSYCIG